MHNMKKYIRVENKKILEIKDEVLEEELKNYVEIESDLHNLEIISQYKYDGSKLVKNVEEINKRNAIFEIEQIQSWFAQNDWKINKVFLGEWELTDSRYVEYVKERKAKRARYDELLKGV